VCWRIADSGDRGWSAGDVVASRGNHVFPRLVQSDPIFGYKDLLLFRFGEALPSRRLPKADSPGGVNGLSVEQE